MLLISPIPSGSRPFNTSFQVSTSSDAAVIYSVQVSATLSLTSGQTGTVSLQVSQDNVTFNEASRISNGNTGALTVGLNLAQTICQPLVAMIPAGYFVKLVTSGTATITYIAGQETLL